MCWFRRKLLHFFYQNFTWECYSTGRLPGLSRAVSNRTLNILSWPVHNRAHVESNYILQPPKYLIIVVNRFRYINKNFTKGRYSIPMDMTVVLGLHKFSLQATIDHHGPSMYSGHHTDVKIFYRNDSKITEFEMIDTKKSSAAYVVIMYKSIT